MHFINSYISRGILPLINAQVKVELNDKRLPNNTVTLKVCVILINDHNISMYTHAHIHIYYINSLQQRTTIL